VHRSVLGLDRDALLLFEVHGVHGALLDVLVGTVDAAFLEELVDEGGLPVVNVGNNGDVTDVLVHGADGFWLLKKGRKCGGPGPKARPKADGMGLARRKRVGLLGQMASTSPVSPAPTGRVVTAESLAVAAEVAGRPLAEPWRRLVAIMVDLGVVALLSLLSTAVLGAATGVLLAVLLGNNRDVPWVMKAVRWICRGIGLALVGLSVLALGHVSAVQSRELNLDALTGRARSAAMEDRVVVRPEASAHELRVANDRLQQQVAALKEEYLAREKAGASWLYQARGFSGALGVTFGWSGIYFTLIVGLWQGRTLGKFLMRIRTLKLNGQPMTFFDGFIRHGGYVAGVAMGLLGFFRLLWEPNRQAVEDRIAGTVVVKG
jgi:uncharacterized RDD family membrane protein YckC